jgi:Vam6/Vps39-like protein vacuolar protein sorting-associated protein 39
MNLSHFTVNFSYDEARAILLGRLGRHDQALETYVYRLQNYAKAEEYVNSLIFPDQF